uniref:Uncharacterized protein n=1 Tax=Anguilla anguilla TaxID=7936 RepID=A0A0E9XL46_ANGAN
MYSVYFVPNFSFVTQLSCLAEMNKDCCASHKRYLLNSTIPCCHLLLLRGRSCDTDNE